MNLSSIDIILIVFYFGLILYIGFFIAGRKEKNSKSSVDFLLAGRNLTLPIFIATLVATWYGNILGIGEFIYEYGIVAWVCFAFPYYISAYFFAKHLSTKIRDSESKTIPEQISRKYGEKAGWISSFIVLVITIPAAYILMLGVMIELLFGFDLVFSIVLGAILSLAFLFTGGFKADVLTNTAQFIIMYIGFGVLLIYALLHYGSFDIMLNKLPSEHKTLTNTLGWQYILSWFIISLQTFIDPGFHQRCAAVKRPDIAKKGILISIVFWIIFDSMTLITGLYARAYIGLNEPMMSYPILADTILPLFWKGIFIIALLSTIMSTLDSYAFLSAATIGNDILKPLRNRFSKLQQFSTKNLIQIGLLITSIFAVGLSVVIPSAVDLIYKTSSIAIPGMIIPLIASYSKSVLISQKKVVVMMIVSSLSSFVWTLLKDVFHIDFVGNFEPMMIGIVISFVLFLLFFKKGIAND